MVFNGAQVHLLVNHFAVVGLLAAIPALLVAMFMKNHAVKRFVLVATAVAGLSALPAFWSGEPAEEVVEHLPGVQELFIEAHEEAAELATVLSVITGLAAAGALLVRLRLPSSFSRTIPGVFILTVVSAAALGRAAHEGGMIMHPEIRGAAVSGGAGDAGASGNAADGGNASSRDGDEPSGNDRD